MTKASAEHPLALQINHLPRFAEREGHGVFVSREGVGADETMLLERAGDFPLDRAGGLILTFVLERGGADDETLIFDGLGRFFASAAGGGRRRTERLETTWVVTPYKISRPTLMTIAVFLLD